MENKKFVKKSFWVHQFRQEEEFLMDMRRKGWKFVNLYKGIPTKYEFERCEPEDYIYQIDYVEAERNTEDYHQLFKDAGWEEIMPWPAIGGTWYYFGRKADEKNERIYTDVDSKIHLMDVLWKRYSIYLGITIFLELIGIWGCYSMVSHEGIISVLGCCGILLGIVYFLIILWVLYNLIAILHTKKSIQKSKKALI